jgi:hypothetical protein
LALKDLLLPSSRAERRTKLGTNKIWLFCLLFGEIQKATFWPNALKSRSQQANFC